MKQLVDVNVVSAELVPTPRMIKEEIVLPAAAAENVSSARQSLEDILDGKDPRLMLLAGPCSIHDLDAAREYAQRLSKLAKDVQDVFVILMRVYFVKPRTTVGWKGFINDPRLDDSFRLKEGLVLARKFLLELAAMNVPAGTEALDSIIPQFIDDLISWHAIGARTTESQTHREMASGLSTPIGFKNGTDGSIEVAVNALKAARRSHHFLGINHDGQCAVLQTRGNAYGHIVLRGGSRPNYDSVSIALCEKALAAAGLPVNIMVDCSHGNSSKDPSLQPLVVQNCVNQILDGNESIVGLMIESNLEAGSQTIPSDRSKLRYGVSVTDGCISWETTEQIVRDAANKLRPRIPTRRSAKR